MGAMACEQGAGQASGAVVWTLTEREFLEMDYRVLRERCYLTEPEVKITVEWLLGLALRAEDRHSELLVRFPSGTVHTERNMMRELGEDAIEVAAWMERDGQVEATYAGPFGPKLPGRGAAVKIKRGAEVFSTHPEVKRVALARVLPVKAVRFDSGFVDVSARPWRNEQRVRNPAVHWAGTGGYWRWTDANNILAAA